MPGILAGPGMASFEMSGFETEMVIYPDGGFINRHHVRRRVRAATSATGW